MLARLTLVELLEALAAKALEGRGECRQAHELTLAPRPARRPVDRLEGAPPRRVAECFGRPLDGSSEQEPGREPVASELDRGSEEALARQPAEARVRVGPGPHGPRDRDRVRATQRNPVEAGRAQMPQDRRPPPRVPSR